MRFEDRRGDEDGSFNSLRSNTVFRIGLFLLGTVPQFVKISASRGVPWTQTWCAAFLASFMIDEVLLLAASPHPRPRVRPTVAPAASTEIARSDNQTYRRFTRLVLWSSVALALSFFTHCYDRPTNTSSGGPTQFPPPGFYADLAVAALRLLFIMLPVVEALAMVSAILGVPAPEYYLLSYPPILILLLVTEANGTFHWSFRMVLGPTTLRALSITTLLAPAAAFLGYERLSKAPAPQEARYVHFGLGAYFFSVQLLAALLYHRIVYDPSSTHKPQWTNILG